MRVTNFLAILPPFLTAWTYAQVTDTLHNYNEHLELQPLANNHLHADFTFNSSISLSDYSKHHYRHFPRSLAQILQYTHTAELHLRFALGRWDDELWGPRPRDGSREGGTGVELWAWVNGESEEEIEARWQDLVNSLSGLFCASLNFIDSTKTTHPILTFEPEGDVNLHGTSKLMHGMLPREVICTENLTPFLKLLPCKGKAGISSLLDGHKLFDSTWQSMSIDIRRRCSSSASNDHDCALEIEQGISMALSIPRSMRNRHDPIPRPGPVEDINCDEKWRSHDSCFPRPFAGELAWSLSGIFGHSVQGACQIGDDKVQDPSIVLKVDPDRDVGVIGASDIQLDQTERRYTIDSTSALDLNASRQDEQSRSIQTSQMQISRQLTGHGQERGGMQAVLHNKQPFAQKLVYFESLPWFLRPYMHTLTVEGAEIREMYYTPLIDRKRGTHLELMLEIPAHTTATLRYDVEKAILRYTEYPPDANRGFDIGAAVIRLLSTGGSPARYMRTTSLLLPLPTPDFSMPYNVIILTSTVIALGFGSIFNLLVRRFVLLEEVPKSPLAIRAQQILDQFRQRFARRSTNAVAEIQKAATDRKVNGKAANSTDGVAEIQKAAIARAKHGGHLDGTGEQQSSAEQSRVRKRV